jgi:hypothetical protein
MKEIDEREFSDLVCEELEKIGEEVLLNNPSTDSKFPCRVINTPLKSVEETDDEGNPIKLRFQCTIQHWNGSQRECMNMSSKTDKQLRKKNIIRTNTSEIIKDTVTKKYRLLATYEVRYNCISDSFNKIK